LGVDPEPTGANFNWDFSSLNPASQDTIVFVAPSSTDILYFLLWGAADQAQAIDVPPGLDLGGFEVNDVFAFLNKTSSAYTQTSVAAKVTGLPLLVTYDQPDRLFTLPMNYGDANTTPITFETGLPGVVTIKESGTRSTAVDGWGTLTTPYGSFDVLRVRSELDVVDSITTTGGDIVLPRTTIEYRWMGLGSGLPLLQIDVQAGIGIPIVSRIAYLDSLRISSIGAPDAGFGELSIHPNPARTWTALEWVANTPQVFRIDRYDVSGRLMENLFEGNLSSGPQRLALSLSPWTGASWIVIRGEKGAATRLLFTE
jgi:hypothetical protein